MMISNNKLSIVPDEQLPLGNLNLASRQRLGSLSTLEISMPMRKVINRKLSIPAGSVLLYNQQHEEITTPLKIPGMIQK